jgi:hypothetical protein
VSTFVTVEVLDYEESEEAGGQTLFHCAVSHTAGLKPRIVAMLLRIAADEYEKTEAAE